MVTKVISELKSVSRLKIFPETGARSLNHAPDPHCSSKPKAERNYLKKLAGIWLSALLAHSLM